MRSWKINNKKINNFNKSFLGLLTSLELYLLALHLFLFHLFFIFFFFHSFRFKLNMAVETKQKKREKINKAQYKNKWLNKTEDDDMTANYCGCVFAAITWQFFSFVCKTVKTSSLQQYEIATQWCDCCESSVCFQLKTELLFFILLLLSLF